MLLVSLFFLFVSFDLGEILSTKWIDEIWDEIFLFGALFEDFFLVFDDDFIVGNFDNFFARDGKLWVEERFECWALDDDLLDNKAIRVYGKARNLTEFGVLFGFNF